MPSLEDLKHYKKIHHLNVTIDDNEKKLLSLNMPVQKIVGFINFDNLKINVNKNVLIPRYETEELVNKALPFLNAKSKVLDLGCGSGYIGLTIKQKIGCNVTLSDIDDQAVTQTKQNAQLNHLNVKIIKSNMFDNLNGQYDLIISNPPYIPSGTILDNSVINFEPLDALFGGIDGNDYYKIIIKKAPLFLKKGGILMLEMSEDNYSFLISHNFEIINDINGKPRIAIKHY